MPDRIMVVEDDHELRELLREILQEAGYAPAVFPSGEAALLAVEAGEESDLVITDLVLPGIRGQDLLQDFRRRRPEAHVIVMTAFGSIESAIEMVRAGAFDYLTKPLGTEEFLVAVERALDDSRRRRDVARQARAAVTGAPLGFVGVSRAMQELYSLIARASVSPHAVLITGESGTGKELVARALHRLSSRDAFVTVNCGALPESLLESELFGHERGSFTGADRAKEGLFHVADRGTLFLDEIAELPLALQPKLLRALEHSEIRRVGATKGTVVDVRLIAATNRTLEAEVDAGRFRDDLFWRLNVLTVHAPPLRERVGDIPLLADYFLARATDEGKLTSRNAPAIGATSPHTISEEAMATLVSYPWPGNVRELKNAILRAATLASGPTILPDDLPPRIHEAGRAATLMSAASRRHLTLDEVECMYILQVLREVGGNKSRAAEALGLDRKTLYRKLEEYRTDDPTLAV